LALTTARLARSSRAARGSESDDTSAVASAFSLSSRPLLALRLKMWRSVIRTVASRGLTRARRSTLSTKAASFFLSKLVNGSTSTGCGAAVLVPAM
jgi:hypothetical protein